MRREFLQLAKVYDPSKHSPAGWYLSEKLDGIRAFWDGGITRGVPTLDVPWSGIIHPKTGKLKDNIVPVATGLWSRYGNPIVAPDWFLNLLPCIPLDGELWAGRGKFQTTTSITRRKTPDERWNQIQYCVYGTPSMGNVFADGDIKNPNMMATIEEHTRHWVVNKVRQYRQFLSLALGSTFDDEVAALSEALDSDRVHAHRQIKLSARVEEAKQQIEDELQKVLDRGGEGIMLRDPQSQWTPKRVATLLKYKPFTDDDGTLVGFTAGRGKHVGRIGAFVLDYKGKTLELGGMTDIEREFVLDSAVQWSLDHPGENMPEGTQGKHFKIGDTISFKYRELSDAGIPKEARLWRKRNE